MNLTYPVVHGLWITLMSGAVGILAASGLVRAFRAEHIWDRIALFVAVVLFHIGFGRYFIPSEDPNSGFHLALAWFSFTSAIAISSHASFLFKKIKWVVVRAIVWPGALVVLFAGLWLLFMLIDIQATIFLMRNVAHIEPFSVELLGPRP